MSQANGQEVRTDSGVSERSQGSKSGGGGRRKAGGSSCRLGFQYPDVFGRRRSHRGGSVTARRTAITSGARINFRRHTAQTRRDDVTSANDVTNALKVRFQHGLQLKVVYSFL